LFENGMFSINIDILPSLVKNWESQGRFYTHTLYHL